MVKGFRPGHEWRSLPTQRMDGKKNLMVGNPITALPLAHEERAEYEDNIKKIKNIWRQLPDDVYQKRKQLEKTLLMLKEIRRTCNGTVYLLAIDSINKDFKILGDVGLSQKPALKKKIIADLNGTVGKYMHLYNRFNDECVCENIKKQQPIDKKAHHKKIIDEESEKLFNELEDRPDDLWLRHGLEPEKNQMLVSRIELIVFKREFTELLSNCDCDESSSLIYSLYNSTDDLFESIASSDKHTLDEKRKLGSQVINFTKTMTSPLINFGALCSCHRRAIPLRKDAGVPVSEDVKELPDNWKRRTLYRLGGE